MTATLKRRLGQLEQIVQRASEPAKRQNCVLLAQPAPEASAEVQSKFQADKDAALKQGDMVLLLVGVRPRAAADHGPNVMVVHDEAAAVLEVLARTPSDRGRTGRLVIHDVLDSLSGNVVRPVKEDEVTTKSRSWRRG